MVAAQLDELQVYALQPHYAATDDGTYGVLGDPMAPARLPTRLSRGSVVVLRPSADGAWTELAGTMEAVATRVSNSTFALWPDHLAQRTAVQYAARARLLGIRAIIWTHRPLTSTLRAELTDPVDWPTTVVHWVRRRKGGLRADAASLLHILARHATEHRRLKALTVGYQLSNTQWKTVFEANGLGSPAVWHSALRVVGIALAIQRNPGTRLSELAFEIGLSGAGALADRVTDVVGASPSFIRKHLGGAWMLADAVKGLKLM